MPHVIVKLWPGKSDEQKQALADAITADLQRHLGSTEASISIALEEVAAADWAAQVVEPDIRGRAHTLLRKPGYPI